jgi:hypothetical protein
LEAEDEEQQTMVREKEGSARDKEEEQPKSQQINFVFWWSVCGYVIMVAESRGRK